MESIHIKHNALCTLKENYKQWHQRRYSFDILPAITTYFLSQRIYAGARFFLKWYYLTPRKLTFSRLPSIVHQITISALAPVIAIAQLRELFLSLSPSSNVMLLCYFVSLIYKTDRIHVTSLCVCLVIGHRLRQFVVNIVTHSLNGSGATLFCSYHVLFTSSEIYWRGKQ